MAPSIRLIAIGALILTAGLALGCPARPSLVGTWQVSHWDGPCEGDPLWEYTVSFERGGGGSAGPHFIAWEQDNREVQYTLTTNPIDVVYQYEGEFDGRNRLEGTHSNGSGCWQATRLSSTP